MSTTLEVHDEIRLLVKRKQVELMEKYNRNFLMMDISSAAIKIGLDKVEQEIFIDEQTKVLLRKDT